MQAKDEETMTVQEAAEALGISPARVRQLIVAGTLRSELRYADLGMGKHAIPVAEVERFKLERVALNREKTHVRGRRYKE